MSKLEASLIGIKLIDKFSAPYDCLSLANSSAYSPKLTNAFISLPAFDSHFDTTKRSSVSGLSSVTYTNAEVSVLNSKVSW